MHKPTLKKKGGGQLPIMFFPPNDATDFEGNEVTQNLIEKVTLYLSL